MELAGTDQMDIRYREKQADPQLSANDPLMQQILQQKQNVTKPAFVPLQVSRKAVKSVKEKDTTPPVDEAKFVIGGATEKLETANEGEVKKETTPRPSVSKESTPQRSLGKVLQRKIVEYVMCFLFFCLFFFCVFLSKEN